MKMTTRAVLLWAMLHVVSAWNCPAGYVGNMECEGENSDCCGDSTVGTKCPDGQDCYCFQWNCRRLSPGGTAALPGSGNSSELTAGPRRLWECPAGYVGNAECEGENSDCCGDETPGINCPNGDCYCFAWNCNRRLSSETEVVQGGEGLLPAAAPRKLWNCPAGYVGNMECEGENSDCCGDSTVGTKCPDGQDCYCFQWNCRRLSPGGTAALPGSGNSSELTAGPRRLWECPAGYVGNAECEGENSDCCGDETPGINCPNGDCYCFAWNCNRRLSSVMAAGRDASSLTSSGSGTLGKFLAPRVVDP